MVTPEITPSPMHLYGDLFVDVQMQQVFADGKTFVDATPKRLAPALICAMYAQHKGEPGFSLLRFVRDHFNLPMTTDTVVVDVPRNGILEHIRALWPLLVRSTQAQTAAPEVDSLLPLPHPYVVPGGRFREVYYWDSYFTMQGLVADGQRALAQQMLDNFASLIDRYGFIPNSNRSYMLSRSQPPFFYKMVACLASDDEAAAYARYLPQLRAEHAFWMAGELGLQAGEAQAHVVRLPDGCLLNRYWDTRCDPREESYRDDVLTAQASQRPAEQVYRDLRAGAESGWDFSSRWCADPQHLHSIETTAILPVDLNCLLWGLECAIAAGAKHAGQGDLAAQFELRAEQRRSAVLRLMWHETQGHFVDFHWQQGLQRPGLTCAALVPLYVGLASADQALASAQTTRRALLAKNGLLTTTERTGQQWDTPNGWAPLQVMAVEGLQRYGHGELACNIAHRWLASVHRVYLTTGKLLEKYDAETDQPGGGGEYPTQDGFGWTNGSFVVMLDAYPFARPL